MTGVKFSPLAPAIILLLGIFILTVIIPRLLTGRPKIRLFVAPGLAGTAVLSLIGIRFYGQEQLSGWNLSMAETAVALTVKADDVSLPFLVLSLLFLLGITLYIFPVFTPDIKKPPISEREYFISSYFLLVAAACFLFVSANALTVGYAIFAFDLLTVFYWFISRRHNNLAVSRLFLAVFTSGAVMLTALPAVTSGVYLFSVAVWLRLVLFPLIEGWEYDQQQVKFIEPLAYFGLSLMVGLNLVVRLLAEPLLPDHIRWFVVITILLAGLVYFRPQIINWLKSAGLINLGWLPSLWGEINTRFGKALSRVNLILERQRYIGWVFLSVLTALLIIILRFHS